MTSTVFSSSLQDQLTDTYHSSTRHVPCMVVLDMYGSTRHVPCMVVLDMYGSTRHVPCMVVLDMYHVW